MTWQVLPTCSYFKQEIAEALDEAITAYIFLCRPISLRPPDGLWAAYGLQISCISLGRLIVYRLPITDDGCRRLLHIHVPEKGPRKDQAIIWL